MFEDPDLLQLFVYTISAGHFYWHFVYILSAGHLMKIWLSQCVSTCRKEQYHCWLVEAATKPTGLKSFKADLDLKIVIR